MAVQSSIYPKAQILRPAPKLAATIRYVPQTGRQAPRRLDRRRIRRRRGNRPARLCPGGAPRFRARAGGALQSHELSPNDPEFYYQRANAYWANNQADLALADFEHVIALKQDFLPAYLPRAEIKLSKHDEQGALADLESVDTLAPSRRT
jgi:tetratricopeptide (TPR) repeat protein